MLKDWPIILIVVSNIIYQICSKSSPKELHPLAMLVITYLIGALGSFIAYHILAPNANIVAEYKHLNWTAFVLGVAVVGLESGYLYLYKLGWNINTGYMVVSILIAISLLFVGLFLYNESISLTKILGIVVCLIGMFLLRK